MPTSWRFRVAQWAIVAGLLTMVGACAVAPARNEDPWQGFNRKMYAFNRFADRVAIKPAAKAYVKVTGPKERVHISDFFANLRTPISIVNEALQGRPGPALDSTARFLINTTLGVLGLFDPATKLGVPRHTTDFGVTLARWGVPQGPYLVLPFIGPTTVRDLWQWPVDSYYLNPLGWYANDHDFKWYVRYPPELLYLVTVRASVLPFDQLLDSAFDPYAFMRDAYLQHRLSQIYFGNPPLSAMEQLQGTTPSAENERDIEQLLRQQRQYEKSHPQPGNVAPAPPASVPPPATATPPSSTPAPAM